MVELWEKQDKENSQSFTYFKIYLYEIQKLPKTYQDVVDFVVNLDQDIESGLRVYCGDLIKIPTRKQIEKLGAKWKWKEREAAYQNHLVERDHQKDEEYFNSNRVQMDNLIGRMIEVTEENVEDLEKSEYKTSTKIQLGYTVSRTLDLLNKNLRLNHSRPTTISETKQDVTVDADVNYYGLEELADAFNKGKDEYLKQKGKE